MDCKKILIAEIKQRDEALLLSVKWVNRTLAAPVCWFLYVLGCVEGWKLVILPPLRANMGKKNLKILLTRLSKMRREERRGRGQGTRYFFVELSSLLFFFSFTSASLKFLFSSASMSCFAQWFSVAANELRKDVLPVSQPFNRMTLHHHARTTSRVRYLLGCKDNDTNVLARGSPVGLLENKHN